MPFANGYQTTTTGSLTSGATSVTVASTTGIPAVPFTATIAAEGANTDEIVLVTANASGTLTLTRGYELMAGVGASAHASGATIAAIVTSGYLNSLIGADTPPAVVNANDDEFDAFSGWTTYGTLDSNNVTDFPSHWHGKRVLAAASMAGIFKTAPSMPFTATCKLLDSAVDQNNQFAGLMVLEASPGKATFFGQVQNSGNITCVMYRWTNATTFASSVNGTSFANAAINTPPFQYMRIIVTSTTDVTLQVSNTGMRWRAVAITSQNPSLTIANIGLVIGDVNAASTVEAIFDWIRFT